MGLIADKTYVYKGNIYLQGSQLPDDLKEFPKGPNKSPFLTQLIGPQGPVPIESVPIVPANARPETPGIEAGEEPLVPPAAPGKVDVFESLGVEDLTKMAQDRGLKVTKGMAREDLIKSLRKE